MIGDLRSRTKDFHSCNYQIEVALVITAQHRLALGSILSLKTSNYPTKSKWNI